MRECLHIFQKDARRYWPYALVLLILRTAGAWSAHTRFRAISLVPVFLVPMATCALLAMVIQEDSPADDDAFWLTRPYRRLCLAAGKAMFALVMICPAVLAGDLLWFWRDGVLTPEAFGLALWRQALLVGWILLGSAAVASVTRGIGQFLFAGVAMLLLGAAGMEGFHSHSHWGAVAWIRGCLQLALAAAAGLAVVLWQFRRRKLAWARIMLLGALALVVAVEALLPFRASYALQTRIAPAPETLRLSLDPSRNLRHAPLYLRGTGPQRVNIVIPVTITGVPAGQELFADAVNLCVQPAGAGAECTDWWSTAGLESSPAGYWAWFNVDREWYRRLGGQPATLRVAAGLTLFADSPRSSGNACNAWSNQVLFCRTLDTSVRLVAVNQAGIRRPLHPHQSYGPEPWSVESMPYTNRSLFRIAAADRPGIVTQRPVGHALREITIANTSLSAFASLQ